MSWELLAGIAIALLLAALGVWRLVASWGSQKAKGATARDDLAEREADAEVKARMTEVKRNAPKTPAALAAWLRGRLPKPPDAKT